MWHELIPNMNSRTQKWYPKVGSAVLRSDNPFSAGLSGLHILGSGVFGKHLFFDGTGPSKTLTTLGINKQENQKNVFRNATANRTKTGIFNAQWNNLSETYFLMFLPLALKRYACMVFAVGLFVCVFPVYLSQGWLPVCGCINNASQILWQRGSRFQNFRTYGAAHRQTPSQRRLEEQSFDLTASDLARTLHRNITS